MADSGKDLNIAEITELLQTLGDQLAQRKFKQPVRVVMFGGVYMLTQVKNRETTRDIDIKLLDLPPMSTVDVPEDTQKFRQAVKAVAKLYGLKGAWLNDDGSMFMGFAPNAHLSLWKTFNMLEVYIPDIDVILVLKLMAGRGKDGNDIAVLSRLLGVKTRKQAQSLVNDYVAGHWQKEYGVEKTIYELYLE